MTQEYLEAMLDGPGRKNGIAPTKGYLVQISVDCPFPKTFEYRPQAMSIAPAVSRALKLIRKDLPRKKIKEYRIKAFQL